jgi:hypothetical protein
MFHLKELWHSLSDWEKQVIFAAIVSASGVLALGAFHLIPRIFEHKREKRCGRILDSFDVFPTPDQPQLFSVAKTPEIIAQITGLPLKKVESDLRKLEKESRVYRAGGYWYRGPRPSPPVHISRSSF